jgi:hypothetical protein
MTRPVYSVCFFEVAGAAVDAVFTVPPGDTAIVNHMSFYNAVEHPAAEGSLALSVAVDNVAVFIWTLQAGNLLPGVYQWTGREVFTDFMEVNSAIAATSFRACGLLLTAT